MCNVAVLKNPNLQLCNSKHKHDSSQNLDILKRALLTTSKQQFNNHNNHNNHTNQTMLESTIKHMC